MKRGKQAGCSPPSPSTPSSPCRRPRAEESRRLCRLSECPLHPANDTSLSEIANITSCSLHTATRPWTGWTTLSTTSTSATRTSVCSGAIPTVQHPSFCLSCISVRVLCVCHRFAEQSGLRTLDCESATVTRKSTISPTTMLESLVVGIINRYLGDYVEGLNGDQLRVAVWNGKLQGRLPTSTTSKRSALLLLMLLLFLLLLLLSPLGDASSSSRQRCGCPADILTAMPPQTQAKLARHDLPPPHTAPRACGASPHQRP